MRTAIIVLLVGALPVAYSYGYRYGYEAASTQAIVEIKRVGVSCETNMQDLAKDARDNLQALEKTCKSAIDKVLGIKE